MKKTHLTFNERKTIENMLKEGASFRNIGERISKSHTTISREIKSKRISEQKGAWGMPFNNCINRFECSVKGMCKGKSCKAKTCRKCKVCLNTCKDYEKEICAKLNSAPYVCNGCKERRKCTLEKWFYTARLAQKEYEYVLKDFREGINMDKEEFSSLIKTVKSGLDKGQSLYHIHQANKNSIMCSSRSLYNYVNLEDSGITKLDMPRQARFKKRKQKKILKLDRKCREGRTLDDFKIFLEENPGISIAEMDTIIGTGKKTILTIYLIQKNFLIARLLERNTASEVIDQINILDNTLGRDIFKTLFTVFKPDNGSEFSNPIDIEFDENSERRTHVFYCDPYSSYQKGGVENANSMIRRILPKKSNFDNLSQKDIDLITSHINSYSRNDLGGLSPYKLFESQYNNIILKLLGISYVPANDIILKSSLLD